MQTSTSSQSNRKIFVGRIPVLATETDLEGCLSRIGPIENLRINRSDDGKSQGFAFVLFSSEDSVSKALNTELILKGRILKIKRIKSKAEMKKIKKDIYKRKIFVGGINKKANENDLIEYFEKFGRVVEVNINRFHSNEMSRGSGFVLFSEEHEALSAINYPREHIMFGVRFECHPSYSKRLMKKKAEHEELEFKAKFYKRSKKGKQYDRSQEAGPMTISQANNLENKRQRVQEGSFEPIFPHYNTYTISDRSHIPSMDSFPMWRGNEIENIPTRRNNQGEEQRNFIAFNSFENSLRNLGIFRFRNCYFHEKKMNCGKMNTVENTPLKLLEELDFNLSKLVKVDEPKDTNLVFRIRMKN